MKMRNKKNQVPNNRPLVTVVTTVLNGVDHIEQAIQSVLNQTYDNIEYIITDGGSTDGTLDIIERYKDYLSHFRSEPDKGIYDGINKGIKLAKGRYIIVLNSDDYYVDDAIEFLVYSALRSGADIVAGHAIFLNPDDTVAKKVESRWTADIYLHATLRHEAMLVSSEAYKHIGFYDTSRRVISDRLWMIKAYENEVNVAICDEVVVFFRQAGISSVGENGKEIRFEEAASYLAYLDPSLSENDLYRLARPMLLTIEEIDYYIAVSRARQLRDALLSLRQWCLSIMDRRLSMAWETLLSSKRWQIGRFLVFFLPVSFEEREAFRQINRLVADFKSRNKSLTTKSEDINLEEWVQEFQLKYVSFIHRSKRWKVGNYIVSLTNRSLGKDNTHNPEEVIKQYLAMNRREEYLD